MQKTWKITETLANGYSSENTQWELSNEYQQDRVKKVFKDFCILVLRANVASALEGLTHSWMKISLTRKIWTYATYENCFLIFLFEIFLEKCYRQYIPIVFRAFVGGTGMKGLKEDFHVDKSPRGPLKGGKGGSKVRLRSMLHQQLVEKGQSAMMLILNMNYGEKGHCPWQMFREKSVCLFLMCIQKYMNESFCA